MKRIAVVAALTLAASVLGPAAWSAPAEKNAVIVEVECDTSSVTLDMHPGIGKPLWDLSLEEVHHGPDFLIKTVTHEVYVNGEFVGVFTWKFGERVGQGEVITCTFHEVLYTGDGDRIDIYGVGERVRTRVPH